MISLTMKLLFLSMMLIAFPSCTSNAKEEYEISYFPDSTVESIQTKLNGKLDGKTLVFNEDGYKRYEAEYRDGLLDGKLLTYYRGKLSSVEKYQNGLQHGWSRYYNADCGFITSEGEYKEGVIEGMWYSYYAGVLESVYKYSHDTVVQIIYDNPDYDFSGVTPPPIPLTSDECCCRSSTMNDSL